MTIKSDSHSSDVDHDVKEHGDTRKGKKGKVKSSDEVGGSSSAVLCSDDRDINFQGPVSLILRLVVVMLFL